MSEADPEFDNIRQGKQADGPDRLKPLPFHSEDACPERDIFDIFACSDSTAPLIRLWS